MEFSIDSVASKLIFDFLSLLIFKVPVCLNLAKPGFTVVLVSLKRLHASQIFERVSDAAEILDKFAYLCMRISICRLLVILRLLSTSPAVSRALKPECYRRVSGSAYELPNTSRGLIA